MASPRFALARSFRLTSALDALVTDDGGPLRTASIAASGLYLRARLASALGAGTSSADPLELLSTTALGLSAGAGVGSYTVTQGTTGLVTVTWSGPGSSTIAAGALTRALGFAGSISCTAGGSDTAEYPPLGMLLWTLVQSDTDWLAIYDFNVATDNAGYTYSRGSGAVHGRREIVAMWVPRQWSANVAGEYLSPIWSETAARIPPTVIEAATPHSLTSARAETWLDALLSQDGLVSWGFTDDWRSLATNSEIANVCVVPGEELALLHEEAPTYRARRTVSFSMTSTGVVVIA